MKIAFLDIDGVIVPTFYLLEFSGDAVDCPKNFQRCVCLRHPRALSVARL